MKRIICVLLALLLCVCSAHAELTATGDVNLRVGPGTDCEIIGVLPKGASIEDTGARIVDERGVRWYCVLRNGQECWVSSKYVEFAGGPDLANYYQEDLEKTAQELGLNQYKWVPSEVPRRFSNEAAEIGGMTDVYYIGLFGEGFVLYGCSVGMDIETVRRKFGQAGLVTDDGDTFEHPAPEDYEMDWLEYDSCIHVICDEDGKVKEFSWSTYTG